MTKSAHSAPSAPSGSGDNGSRPARRPPAPATAPMLPRVSLRSLENSWKVPYPVRERVAHVEARAQQRRLERVALDGALELEY